MADPEKKDAAVARKEADEAPVLHDDNEQDRVEPIVDHGPQQEAGSGNWGEPGRVPDPPAPEPKAKK